MTPVEELAVLREAATAMRVETAQPFPELADWLHTAGADLWAHGPLCECGDVCDACDDSLWQRHVRRALAVARAYLGRAS